MNTKFKCPVCEHALDFEPWEGDQGCQEICPRCNIQFGYDDACGGSPESRNIFYAGWRGAWKAFDRRSMPGAQGEQEDQVSVSLSNAEALVLFEFLSRFSDAEKLTIEDQAEEQVLWALCCLLEKLLVEPLKSNYHELLDTARGLVRDRKDGA